MTANEAKKFGVIDEIINNRDQIKSYYVEYVENIM